MGSMQTDENDNESENGNQIERSRKREKREKIQSDLQGRRETTDKNSGARNESRSRVSERGNGMERTERETD